MLEFSSSLSMLNDNVLFIGVKKSLVILSKFTFT